MTMVLTNVFHGHAVGHAVAAPFHAIGRVFVAIMESNSRLAQVKYFNSLSDAQLAEKGLRREDIVQHVFKGMYYC